MEQDGSPQKTSWVTEAETRVADAEEQVAALVAWIAKLRRLGYDTAQATAALVAVTDHLLRCYEELGQQQAGGGWRRPRRPPDGP